MCADTQATARTNDRLVTHRVNCEVVNIYGDWLDSPPVPVDPLLIDPLNIRGSMRRRFQARALIDELGLGHRVDRYDEDFGHDTINDSTYAIIFHMLDALADIRATRNVSITGAAERVAGIRAVGHRGSCGNNEWRGQAVTAALDFGWGHVAVRAEGDLRDVADYLAAVYVREMTSRVLTMLRQWQRRGYLSNAA